MIETLLFCLVLSFLMVKGPTEDLMYAAKHEESPRQKARRERQTAGHLSATDKLGHAVADRLAQRIATGPERAPMRRYLGDLWEDAWLAATENRREREAWRLNGGATAPEAGPLGAGTDIPDGVNATEETTAADGAGAGRARRRRFWPTWHRPTPASTPTHDDATRDGGAVPEDPTPTPKEDAPDDVIDAEVVDDVIDAEFEVIDDTDPAEPETGEDKPLWQPLALEAAPTESENTMSAPAEGGLSGAISWAEHMTNSTDEAITSLETTASTLETEGWGQAVTGPLREAMDLHTAIKGCLDQSKAALNDSLTVKDAYQAAEHTGHRDSVLAE